MNDTGRLRIGTSGWNYAHWRGTFYPADMKPPAWFAHYAREFDTVEINNTFYRLPLPVTFGHWRQQAPPDFCFAVKANRYLTHRKKLKDIAGPLRKFLAQARRLREHLGPVLYQLPPRWQPNLERLTAFCRRLPGELLHAIEFREPAWLSAETVAVLARYHVCLCIHDMFAGHPREVTGPAAYLRFHGVGARYAGNYADDQLAGWADWMRATARAGHAVYAYFNNDAEANAIRNARTLRALLGQRPQTNQGDPTRCKSLYHVP